MATVKVSKAFYDRIAGAVRSVGDTFEAGDDRVAQLMTTLPGYVEVAAREATREELLAKAKKLGVSIPKNASRAKIAQLIGEADAD